MKVINIMNSSFSGQQHGVGIYSNNDTGGPYAIALSDILVDDFQKNAVALLGAGLTVDLDNITTIGEGATTVTAQNGIQIGPGVSGMVDNCAISLVAYIGDTYTATGFLNWGDVSANNVSIDQCQTSVYWSDGSGTFDNCQITNPLGDGFYAYNSTAKSGGALPREQYQGRGETILVVDDVELQREIAADMLKELGYVVVTAASGQEAVSYLKKKPVDLVVLDMIMPNGMDGLETYKAIIKHRPGQKAVITSGFSETERVHEAQQLGAGVYIKKPYLMEKIGFAIRNELDRRASRES